MNPVNTVFKSLSVHGIGRTWAYRSAMAITVAGLLAIFLCSSVANGHDVYMMNSNHTDYNWNATAAEYEAAMLAELDYYLAQIAATANHPPEEQARYVPDCWWWLYLYQQYRSPAQFLELVEAIRSEHLTIPINPFVTLYGALPTEAAIRAGYYPAKIARQYDLELPLAEYRENHTSPWGLASVWAGSQVKYTWKGVCGCYQSAPSRYDDELFLWEGPDGKTLLFKWYNLLGDNKDWGGYSEARSNLGDPDRINLQITRTQNRMPGVPFTGIFGAGWDDVSWQSSAIIDSVVAYNNAGTGNTAIVSNGIDFFRSIEASGIADNLRVLRGGWGSDWDMWPASLAERTSRIRRALERLRSAEALSAWVQRYDHQFWGPVRDSIELGLFSVWKYFEHGWAVTGSGPSLSQMQADKETWTSHMESVVDGALTAAESRLVALFDTPNVDRIAVFNPLGYERTDFADVEVSGSGPFVVFDVATGDEVPNQMISRDGETVLRFLARGVPSLGFRVFKYQPGTPTAWPPAAVVSPGSRTIENSSYRVVVGDRGQMVEALHKVDGPDVELAGSRGLNDFGSGTVQSVAAENVGPVSATLRVELANPTREVRMTLFAEIDRIDVENRITENVSGFRTYSFHTDLADSEIYFEEIGAIARPGLVTEGGDFLPGTRASRMTLNHFVAFSRSDHHLVISNQDAYAMKVNDSTNDTFDLTGDEVHVVVMEQALGAQTQDQGGDGLFINRFSLRGVEGPLDTPNAMRAALAHQNPLLALALPRNQNGPLKDHLQEGLSVSSDDVVVTAYKPAEDESRGFIVRMWELNDTAQSFDIEANGFLVQRAWHTSLTETDLEEVDVHTGGRVAATIDAREIKTYPDRRPAGLQGRLRNR